MSNRSLLAAALAAAVSLPVFAAAPAVQFDPAKFTITATPGATVAYIYAVRTTPAQLGSGQSTAGSDGTIVISLSGHGSFIEGTMAAVDVATGEVGYAGSYTARDWTNQRGLYPGPSGAYDTISWPASGFMAMWVRPGSGAWSPGARVIPDEDGNPANQVVVSSLAAFAPMGGVPRPAGAPRAAIASSSSSPATAGASGTPMAARSIRFSTLRRLPARCS